MAGVVRQGLVGGAGLAGGGVLVGAAVGNGAELRAPGDVGVARSDVGVRTPDDVLGGLHGGDRGAVVLVLGAAERA